MATKRKPKRGIELNVQARITRWEAECSVIDSGTEPARTCELTLELLEPIKGRTAAMVIIVCDPAPNSPSDKEPRTGQIGSVFSITKTVNMLIRIPQHAMSMLLALASGDRLTSCRFVCDEPYRGQANVSIFHFGTKSAEDLF